MPRNQRRKQRKRRHQAGFTLAEMMVVIILTPLVTTFIFYLLQESSRVSRVIQELNDTQTTLQFAAGSIARDLRRAGYMSIISNADQRLCVAYPSQDFNAMNFRNRDSTFSGSVGATNNVRIEPDALELFGNFTTTDDFPAYVNPGSANSITIEFAGTEINSATAFERAFGSPNQLVMVKGQTGRLQIVQLNIAGNAQNLYNVATSRATVPIRTGGSSLGFNTSSTCGVAIRFRVAPLHKIRYRVSPRGPNDWELLREVLDPGNCTSSGSCSGGNWAAYGVTAPHPPLVIAPNAVDLQFWFTTWASGAAGPTNWDPICRTGQVSSCVSNATTVSIHNDTQSHWPSDRSTIRSVYFRVSVRSSNEDETLNFITRPNVETTIVTYEVDSGRQGSARVRSLVKNVMIPNMLAR